MSLQEKFANPPKAARACGIKRLRAELALDPKTHNELIALNGMLESKDDWPDRALLAALQEEGYGEYVSIRIIERHRSLECACR